MKMIPAFSVYFFVSLSIFVSPFITFNKFGYLSGFHPHSKNMNDSTYVATIASPATNIITYFALFEPICISITKTPDINLISGIPQQSLFRQ
jgi:hypothetical protein